MVVDPLRIDLQSIIWLPPILPHRIAAHIDAMRVVDQLVEDAVPSKVISLRAGLTAEESWHKRNWRRGAGSNPRTKVLQTFTNHFFVQSDLRLLQLPARFAQVLRKSDAGFRQSRLRFADDCRWIKNGSPKDVRTLVGIPVKPREPRVLPVIFEDSRR